MIKKIIISIISLAGIVLLFQILNKNDKNIFIATETEPCIPGVMENECLLTESDENQFSDTAHTSQNSLSWDGIYEGVVPCADCEGIKTTVILNSDNTFVLSEEYLGKSEELFTERGTFSWNEKGSTIEFTIENRKQYYKVGENRLFHLDMEGNIIEGQLADNYILTKQQ